MWMCTGLKWALRKPYAHSPLYSCIVQPQGFCILYSVYNLHIFSLRLNLLWPPCVADADIILHLWFLSLFLSSSVFFFPRLISAIAHWMSTILRHMMCGLSANLECMSEMYSKRLAGNTGCKYYAKIAIFAPSHHFVELYFRNEGTYIDNRGKTC